MELFVRRGETMVCNFPEYTVSKYQDENVKIAGRLWIETSNKIKEAILARKNTVISIIGEPGMGKTTLLNVVKKDLKEYSFILYLDLVNSPSLSYSAWYVIKNTSVYEKIREKAFEILLQHQKDIGYKGLTKFSKEFSNFLRHICEKKNWNNNFSYAEKLYCMSYEENVEGLIEFLNDLSKLDTVALLIDEIKAKDGHLTELHKVINETNIPIIVTMVPDVVSEIKDRALIRRLSEIKIELKLSNDDKLDILKTYCDDFAEEIYKIKEIQEARTLSAVLDLARYAYLQAFQYCKNDYKQINCIRDYIRSAFYIENIEEASKELEKKIREGLIELKGVYGIEYVHDRGRRIDEKSVIVDLYFRKGETVYIGDVKLSNKDVLDNVGNMKKLEDYEKEGSFKVVKFIITNTPNVDLKGFILIYIDNYTIKKILNGDIDARNNLVGKIVRDLKISNE
ncbi:hypothetical protein SJAV_19960 [Sulfurisphaera javensis]|uniref:AAA+ ATPase domain-containing protein n=1 Tax=Sulfurisphaera javensis TaxID=2049879 RepID=A0AAT9GTB6_9CREN